MKETVRTLKELFYQRCERGFGEQGPGEDGEDSLVFHFRLIGLPDMA